MDKLVLPLLSGDDKHRPDAADGADTAVGAFQGLLLDCLCATNSVSCNNCHLSRAIFFCFINLITDFILSTSLHQATAVLGLATEWITAAMKVAADDMHAADESVSAPASKKGRGAAKGAKAPAKGAKGAKAAKTAARKGQAADDGAGAVLQQGELGLDFADRILVRRARGVGAVSRVRGQHLIRLSLCHSKYATCSTHTQHHVLTCSAAPPCGTPRCRRD